MNFINLQYYLVVVEEMNISKAAKRLNLTQQSLSHHIQRLEEELGIALFVRKPGLELTYAGKRFEKAARRIINIEHEVYSDIEDIKKMKYSEFRIGISSSRSSVVLPRICPQFYQMYPDAKLTIIEKNSLELETLLEQGRIDLMIGYSPRPTEHTGTLNIQISDKVAVIPKNLFIDVFRANWEEKYNLYQAGIDFTPFKNAHAAKPHTKCMKNGILGMRSKAGGRYVTKSA